MRTAFFLFYQVSPVLLESQFDVNYNKCSLLFCFLGKFSCYCFKILIVIKQEVLEVSEDCLFFYSEFFLEFFRQC